MAVSRATRTLRRTSAPPRRLAGDVAILGAGIGGVSAALESARLGRKVVLIDAAPSLGGQSVGAAIGTFCGLFANGPDPEQVTHGVADEMLHDLLAAGDARKIVGRRNTVIVQYRIEALARWIEEAVRRAGATVLLGAVLRGVRRAGRRLVALELATRHGDVEVEAAGFVDASGDAALAWNAGLEVREAELPIYGTLMLTLEDVDEAALGALPSGAIRQRLAEKGAGHGLVRQDGFAFVFPGTGEALVNMTHIETPLDPVAASAAVLEGRAQADRLVGFLQAEFPAAFGKARVRSYGLPGVRQTRSIVGRHQLTADEVRAGIRFADAIARCTWPIELHDRPEGVHWEEFDDAHMHYVPFGSLAPAEADNLLAVGRCIDADPVALSSVRVMGPCIAMGVAAAHALDLAGAGSVHQLDLAALRRRVAANLGPDAASAF
jgi:FAD dependent oxidoreductase